LEKTQEKVTIKAGSKATKVEKATTKGSPVQVAVTWTGTAYTMPITFGTSTTPQTFNIQLDTGSCQLNVGSTLCTNCNQNSSGVAQGLSFYDATKSSTSSPQNITQGTAANLCYGTGSDCLNGYVIQETVTIGGVSAAKTYVQAITQATSAPLVPAGIVGMCYGYAYYQKTYGTTNTLKGIIASIGGLPNVFSLASNLSTNSAVLTLGGWNTVQYPMTDNTLWFPVANQKQFYWSVGLLAVNGIAVTNTATSSGPFPLTVDTGAPGMNIPPSIYTNNNAQFLTSLSNTASNVCSWNAALTYITCNCTSLSQMNPLTYTLQNALGGKVTFTIPASSYVTTNSKGACTGNTSLNYKDTDAKWGDPLILQHYMIFDWDNNRIGIIPNSGTPVFG